MEQPSLTFRVSFTLRLALMQGVKHDGYPAIRNWIYTVCSLQGFVTMPGIHPLHELHKEEEKDG